MATKTGTFSPSQQEDISRVLLETIRHPHVLGYGEQPPMISDGVCSICGERDVHDVIQLGAIETAHIVGRPRF